MQYFCRVRNGVIVVIVAIFAGGCAIVEDTHGDGSVQRSIVFGVVTLPNIPSDRGRVVRITGAGFDLDTSGFAFGYFNKLQVVPDPQCQVVLIDSTSEQLGRFAELIPKETGLCGDSASYRGGK